MVQILAIIVAVSDDAIIPSLPRIKKLITKMTRAIFDNMPLYRIERTGERSSQGSTNKIAIEAPITITPGSADPNMEGVARNMA